ncbi:MULTISPECIES: DUF2163 domain-containing protein [Roseovarius]|uniref:DUF2163 domain-containing protein n=1 Tax=Roseovarius TaxID=74030 RepID=UPI00300FB15C
MKTVSPELAAHLEGDVLTLATCWRLARRDGVVFRATDHDVDLVVDGEIYRARAGYSRTAVASEAGLAVGNVDLEGVLDDAGLEADALRAGLYDGAEVRIFVVNWQDPSQGTLRLRRGWLGEVMLSSEGEWRTELRGLSQVLAQRLIEPYTPDCRADLGDARCGVDIRDPAWTRPGTVTAPLDALSFTAMIDITETPDDWFAGGVIRFTSGPNRGRAIEVRGSSLATGDLVLSFPPPFPVGTGDAFEIWPGCDKRLTTCIDRFDNVLNFRGDPFVPGTDKLTETPNAR